MSAPHMPGATTPRPEPIFTSEEDLRRFCVTAQARLEDWALDVELATAQLQKAMGQIPDGTFVGLTSKLRAAIVAAHLRTASKSLDAASRYVNACWNAYVQRYASERSGA